MGRRRRRRIRRPDGRKRRLYLPAVLAGLAAVSAGICGIRYLQMKNSMPSPEELLVFYMEHIEQKEYEEMYAMLDVEASGSISQEEGGSIWKYR